ncbi:hypothetical protein [Stieleria varia]|uniref:Outer membrane efflux protein n=1 Tax=Stieleria varia TaxID=2528005 RepID=A0A5C5ZJK3_9BACT|nr:hypothetical protein [Stieleria varia]TWT87011.1 hypothetical protein Pla52n_70360 [Stieleria varia]
MSTRTLLCSIAILAVCVGMTAFTNADNNEAAPDGNVRQLLTERRDTLRERLDAVEASYKSGRTETTVVIAAETQLLDAELELTNQPADRIAIRERVVANMKRIEDWTRQQFDNGIALQQDVLLTKAERLQAEIELLRERGIGQ